MSKKKKTGKQVSSVELLNLNADLDSLKEIAPSLDKKEQEAIIGRNFSIKSTAKGKPENLPIESIKDIAYSSFSKGSLIDMPEDADIDVQSRTSFRGNERIEVTRLSSTDKYILIAGDVAYYHAKKKGEKNVQCYVIGTTNSLSQALNERAKIRLKVHDNISPIEKTLGMHLHIQSMIEEFGGDVFTKHGGDRKKKVRPPAHLFMSEEYNLAPWSARAALSFANNISTTGIFLLAKRRSKLSFSKMHSINGRLKKTPLDGDLHKELKSLKDGGKNEKQICDEAGKWLEEILSKLESKKSASSKTSKTKDESINQNLKFLNEHIPSCRKNLSELEKKLKGDLKKLSEEERDSLSEVMKKLLKELSQVQRKVSELQGRLQT